MPRRREGQRASPLQRSLNVRCIGLVFLMTKLSSVHCNGGEEDITDITGSFPSSHRRRTGVLIDDTESRPRRMHRVKASRKSVVGSRSRRKRLRRQRGKSRNPSGRDWSLNSAIIGKEDGGGMPKGVMNIIWPPAELHRQARIRRSVSRSSTKRGLGTYNQRHEWRWDSYADAENAVPIRREVYSLPEMEDQATILELSTQIQNEAEWYMSGYHIMHNASRLRAMIQQTPGGWVPLNNIVTRTRIKAITRDSELVVTALKLKSMTSKVLEIHENGQLRTDPSLLCNLFAPIDLTMLCLPYKRFE
mmetsp:Transcript_31537/g.51228  ORF Transcript_31537/g.51228 Transcript_31537/m.51228 type:complete len:304 (-) Transcript_31537:57-968(-)